MENAAGALQDAMLAMKEIKFSDRPTSMYPFALLARSEAYYTAGDFELALIDFHNGSKIRPDILQFESGVQRCEESIQLQLSVGNIASRARQQRRQKRLANEEKKRLKENYYRNITSESQEAIAEDKMIGNAPRINKIGKKSFDPDKPLLEELFADKLFLQEISADTAFTNSSNGDIGAMVTQGLEYLKTRSEFWRLRNPVESATRKSRASTAVPKRPATAGPRLILRTPSARLAKAVAPLPSAIQTSNPPKQARPSTAPPKSYSRPTSSSNGRSASQTTLGENTISTSSLIHSPAEPPLSLSHRHNLTRKIYEKKVK